MAELVADPGERELGDVLFAATGVAQHLGVDPEAGLRAAARRFDERFRHLERRAAEAGVAIDEIDPEALDQWWQEAKQAGG